MLTNYQKTRDATQMSCILHSFIIYLYLCGRNNYIQQGTLHHIHVHATLKRGFLSSIYFIMFLQYWCYVACKPFDICTSYNNNSNIL